MYPALEIYLERIKENASKVLELCNKSDVDLVGVVKGCSALPEVAFAFLDAGVKVLGDSRIQNVKKLRRAGIACPLMLLRIPMLSEIRDVVELADIALVSDISVIRALDERAGGLGKRFRAVLMIDMGDLREGIWPTNLLSYLDIFKALKSVELWGIGANFGCFSGILPTEESLSMLVNYASLAREYTKFDIPIVSVGGTVSLYLLEKGVMPKGINQLRVGEAILLGKDSSRDREISYLRQDTFLLKAEIVELKFKPSFPIGERGKDAFGKKTCFEDKGVRKKAILALGRQDVDIDGLIPQLEGINVLGGSSDHTILDVSDCLIPLKVGDILTFNLSYGAMLLASTSPYVSKVFIN
ncbi:MAG: alanine/ornithine racemase family PLP-dependent enzyme [Synergistetes bacterium]|nr:alanine/ornithine racemase family PLP-dependent enzyme [Synergistota bacterium]MCX8127689.1 alanine/ornithine racemase family PLP-dependent enzyme [Synergistota bacterium]MDW8191396.1 alanine/ornithine racemase family PLP-dependent enzyme [Synergistota bacterium]